MAIHSKIANFVRWLVTWPVLVVIALNIENAISEAGYGGVISQRWKDTAPVLSDVYWLAASPWVWYPTLMIFGAVSYEWIIFTVKKAESDGSEFQRWLLKQGAESLASAFLHNGIFRKFTKIEEMEKLNKRLLAFGLPNIPNVIGLDEEENQTYGSYLSLLSQGQFEHARLFLDASILSVGCAYQLPPNTESEKQP